MGYTRRALVAAARHRRTSILISLSLVISVGGSATTAYAADPRHVEVTLSPVTSTTFVQPTAIANAGDGRLFVVERRGYVRSVMGSDVQPDPYLDLRRVIRNHNGRNGLLALAFAPHFTNNHFLYVSYTNADGSLQITRLRATSDGATTVSAASRVPILTIPAGDPKTVGGMLAFGPDGMLYIGTGAGGSTAQRAQNLSSLNGKILRIDVEHRCGLRQYCIPADNPFVTNPRAHGEIWLLGMRDPRQFSFDRASGSLWIGDSGEDWEEIDTVGKGDGGRNLGWPCREARHASDRGCGGGALTAPVDQQSHRDGSCGVSGGYVYRGHESRELSGMYLFTDYCTGRIWGRARTGHGRWVRSQVGYYSGNISAFGESSTGELYAVDLGSGRLLAVRGQASGRAHTAGSLVAQENSRPGTRAWYPLQRTGPTGAIEGYASDVSVAPGEEVQFHVSTSTPDTYQIMIFRLGYYHGLGGRLVACLPSCTINSTGQQQPLAPLDPSSGASSQNWPVTDAMTVPASWVSGYYVAKLVLTSGANAGNSAPVPFIVRQDPNAQPTRMLVVSSTNTEQAYNNWGGKSVYGFNSTSHVAATAVSFNRPYAGPVWFFEQRLVQFIESQPTLDPSYAADLDVERSPTNLLRHRFTLVNGHSEYWSKGMRDAYENARDGGVNLAFWGADQGDWQVRYADNGRTMVSYKYTQDPYPEPSEWTTNFSRLNPARPQCQLLGTSYAGGMDPIKSYTVNSAALSDRYFAGTGFVAGDSIAGNTFEYDALGAPGCLAYPATVFFTDSTRPDKAPALRYTTASGSTVFTIGSEALAMLTPQPVNNAGLKRFALNVLTDLSTYEPPGVN